MKIILLTEYFPTSEKEDISGGVEARCLNLAIELAKTHDVTVVTSFREGQKRSSQIKKIKVERVGPHHNYSNEGGFVSRIKFCNAAYKHLIKKKNVDVIDCFNFTTYLTGYRAANKLNCLKVATYHETWIGSWIKNKGLVTGAAGEILEGIAIRLKWDLAIAVSEFTKKNLEKLNVEFPIEVVYNGVEYKQLSKIKSPKRKNFTVSCVARLVKGKRIHKLIAAASKIKDMNLEIVGDGDDKEFFVNLVKDLELKDRVKFHGFVKSNEEVLKIVKSSHVFCLPSAVEGFGITVIESMALGIPVVCSDIKPLKEVTQNGEYALLFKTDNVEDLKDKLSMMKDKKIRDKYAKKSIDRAKFFDWVSLSKKYSLLLKKYSKNNVK